MCRAVTALVLLLPLLLLWAVTLYVMWLVGSGGANGVVIFNMMVFPQSPASSPGDLFLMYNAQK